MKKLSVVLIVLVALLAFGGTTAAQTPVFCGDLPPADCQILEAAQAAALEMTSASGTFNLELTITNIPDAPFKSLAFALEGSGQYAIDADLMKKYAGLQTDPSALMSDISQFGPMLADLLTGFTGQLNLKLSLPQALLSTLPAEGIRIPATLTTELRMVKGVGYINLSALAEAMPSAGIPSGWYGLELAKLVQNVFDMFAGSLDGAALSDFDPSTFTQFADPDLLGEFMTLKRLPDSEVDGQAVAVFEGTLDYTRLATSPMFREMMKQQFEAMDQAPTEAELDQALSMTAQIYQGLTFTFTQAVDLDEYHARQVTIDVGWDMTQLMQLAGESTTPAPFIGLKLTSSLADFNVPVSVAAPANAAVLTAEDAMQMFMSGMQGSF